MTASPNHFFVLAPNFFGFKGGVQVYSALVLQGIQKVYPDARYSVFLKYERSTSDAVSDFSFLPQTRFFAFGERVCDTNGWRRRFRTLLSAATILVNALIYRPALIVTTEINYYVVLCHKLYQRLGIPYWVVLHGIEAWDIKNTAYQKALQGADRVIAVSKYTRDRVLAEGYLNPDQMCVLPNTFDPARFKLQPKPTYLLDRHNLKPEQPIILTVTRLQGFAHYKGYDKILRMLPKIRQQVPDVHYVLVGKGDDRPRIEAMIAELNLQDCVTLTGFVPDEELPDYYSLCDVFAMPSKGEGFGIVYLEALASGRLVLAGNQDGSVDPLLNGKLGCLVDPDDEAAIAAKLIEILQGTYANQNLYNPEWLRQEVCKHFEISRFNANLEGICQKFFFEN
ncbi:MAG: glycosyltransferase [Cyanobacteria bacterium J06635_15]